MCLNIEHNFADIWRAEPMDANWHWSWHQYFQILSESIDFSKLKVIYLKERFLKKYLTDLLKIPYTNRRIKIELRA